MESRTEKRRREQRRVLGWGLVAAAVLHVVAFLLLPGLRTEVPFKAEIVLEGIPAIGGAMVDVRFEPPTITRPDGTLAQEPRERNLQVVRVVNLSSDCLGLTTIGDEGMSGIVSLQVGPDGRAAAPRMETSTGRECADHLIVNLAAGLRYRWLPNDDFPAPVEVSQPVVLVEVVELMEGESD